MYEKLKKKGVPGLREEYENVKQAGYDKLDKNLEKAALK